MKSFHTTKAFFFCDEREPFSNSPPYIRSQSHCERLLAQHCYGSPSGDLAVKHVGRRSESKRPRGQLYVFLEA